MSHYMSHFAYFRAFIGNFIYEKRRGRESNPRIAVLQTATLPLGYPAIARGARLSSAAKRRQRAVDLTIQRFAESGYREGMTNSRDLFARARRRIPGGVNSPVRGFRAVGGEPVFVGRAKGSRIRNVDDVELIDYVGSWCLAIL